MKLNRRDFIKANAAAAAMSVAGMSAPGTALAQGKDDIRWDKAACRFCGTGCGVLSVPRTAAWWPPRVTRMRRSTVA